MPSLKLFLLLAAAVVVLALGFPPHLLVLADLAFVLVPEDWSLGGVLVDASDLAIAGIALTLLLRARESPLSLARRIPYLRTWIALGVVLSLAYLAAPVNREYLTDPVRIAYQLYRYCWKGILYFPLVVLLFAERKRVETLLVGVILAADLCAVEATVQGYSGLVGAGPFETGNQLAGVLVVPFLVCAAALLFPLSRLHLLFSAASFVLLVRALLFAGSRGGFIACLAGFAFFGLCLLRVPSGRARVIQAAVLAAVGLAALVLLIPDLGERPTIERFRTVGQGTQAETFRWRVTERWPHFGRKLLEHPWLGVGTDVDPSLGERANTPHSGYLAYGVIHGLPALALLLLFAGRSVRAGLAAFRHADERRDRLLGLTVAAAMVGLLTHNVAEATLTHPWVAKMFWLLCAVAAMSAPVRAPGRAVR